jgi:hypothetical protein
MVKQVISNVPREQLQTTGAFYQATRPIKTTDVEDWRTYRPIQITRKSSQTKLIINAERRSMKKLLPTILLVAAPTSFSAELEYSDVYKADTGRIGNDSVRFIVTGRSPCIWIQKLVRGIPGKISAESQLCSINGHSFMTDYAYVGIQKGYFKNNKLYMEISTTTKELVSEALTCEVLFNVGAAQSLECRNSDQTQTQTQTQTHR